MFFNLPGVICLTRFGRLDGSLFENQCRTWGDFCCVWFLTKERCHDTFERGLWQRLVVWADHTRVIRTVILLLTGHVFYVEMKETRGIIF